MENLLASIRQAIDDDMSGSAKPVAGGAAAAIRGAMEELRAKPNAAREVGVVSEISELRSKINRSRGVLAEPRTPFAQIMAGQVKVPAKVSQLPAPIEPSSYTSSAAHTYQASAAPAYESLQQDSQAEAYQDGEYAGETVPEWANEGYQPYDPSMAAGYGHEQPHLLSHAAADATQGSFNELANALMARAMGERSIEDMTQELLKAMLRNWLDAHLPGLVERLVREEIERVARRGR